MGLLCKLIYPNLAYVTCTQPTSAGEIQLGDVTGRLAIKKSNPGYEWALLHELQLIRTIDHPNVIKTYMWDNVENDIYMYLGMYPLLNFYLCC